MPNSDRMRTFLDNLMRRRGLLPSQLARELEVSHATVSRWLSGQDVPCPRSCQKLARYAQVPPERVLSFAGHLPPLPSTGQAEEPEFHAYAQNVHRDNPMLWALKNRKGG